MAWKVRLIGATRVETDAGLYRLALSGRRVLLTLAGDLTAAGVSEAAITRAVQVFERAFLEEVFTQLAGGHEQPEGGAA